MGENQTGDRAINKYIKSSKSDTYILVGVTKTEPLRELVWESRKDPDHERQEIHH